MKSVKSLLLGAAAGLFAVAGAQAADLPVKAKPVQYVKICSLYGAGFYYIPGTDMCIKVGGYVRTQAEWGSVNGVSPGSVGPSGFATSPTAAPFGTITNGLYDRSSNNFNMTGRGVLTVDARNQSEYGTVRGYIRLGGQSISNGVATPTFFVERAFIQFAGFTAGRTQSFFDIFTTTERFNYNESKTSGDTYNYGVDLIGYTAQFGNGMSASVSAESPHYLPTVGVLDGSAAAFAVNGATVTDTSGHNMPDIVGQLRIDQNWGYLGISGALHQVSGRYFGTPNVPANGHPDDKTGWAAQVGGLLNLPWADTVGASFAWTKGAVAYATKAGSWQILNGSSAGLGWLADGIFDSPGGFAGNDIQLTNAWSVNAAYEHYWNQRWKTSLYGGYTKVWYDGAATNDINGHLPGAAGTRPCGVPVAGAVWPPLNIPAGGGGNSCSPDFSFYQIGSRTQWNITKDFSMGMDVTYTHLNTAYQGPVPSSGVGGGRNITSVDDQNTWSGVFRTQYNFNVGNEGPSVVFGR